MAASLSQPVSMLQMHPDLSAHVQAFEEEKLSLSCHATVYPPTPYPSNAWKKKFQSLPPDTHS
eukprot:224924-Pelagomonas_calceolata.AAC.1